jgi:hypothetical protein
MQYDLPFLMLATQRALLGMVQPQLRAVIVDLDENKKRMKFYFYYDGAINDDLYDQASCIATEASAAFPPDFTSEEEIERLDAPQKIPDHQGRFVYRRMEI